MAKILIIVGSLRKGSFNRQMAKENIAALKKQADEFLDVLVK